MAGFVVDRTVVPAGSRAVASGVRWVVLVAVALGLLVGALVCAAGLAAGDAHGVHPPASAALPSSELEMHGRHTTRVDDVAPVPTPEPRPTPGHDRGDSSRTSTADGHPGTACVVSIDLRFPEPSATSLSDPHETPAVAMRAGCSADVDPPVPRPS